MDRTPPDNEKFFSGPPPPEHVNFVEEEALCDIT